MSQTAAAERATGYVTGGISPIAQRKVLPVVIDSSATGFETVFCSAGQRGLEVELAPDGLALATGATLASIARPGSLAASAWTVRAFLRGPVIPSRVWSSSRAGRSSRPVLPARTAGQQHLAAHWRAARCPATCHGWKGFPSARRHFSSIGPDFSSIAATSHWLD